MTEQSIVFQFADRRSAYHAFDMLEELGYRPNIQVEEEHPQIHFYVERNDLTSALEIAQAYGGTYVEQQSIATNQTELEAFQEGYQLNAGDIPIPAHTVNEDWSESYSNVRNDSDAMNSIGREPEDHEGMFDHFSADVRI